MVLEISFDSYVEFFDKYFFSLFFSFIIIFLVSTLEEYFVFVFEKNSSLFELIEFESILLLILFESLKKFWLKLLFWKLDESLLELFEA